MSVGVISLKQLRKNIESSDFQDLYYHLILGHRDDLSGSDRQFLLKLSVVFLNYGDKYLVKLGYRIIISYSNLFKDYKPLYDVSINKGYIPISKFIESNYLYRNGLHDNFFHAFLTAYKDNFKSKNVYHSFGQQTLFNFATDIKSSFVLIAPTSYGKSEIIISKVFQNVDKKVCVIVPSKALLAQTKRRLLSDVGLASSVKRIITHPDMYRGTETQFVAVLTQERLLRLIQKNSTLIIDFILVDEAHNLLKSDNRAILLTQVLLILFKRNAKLVLNYYTPFLVDSNSLRIPYVKYDLSMRNTDEYLKVEKYFMCDLTDDKKLYLYDQFINSMRPVSNVLYKNDVDVLLKNKSAKNIVYINRPKEIEELALSLSLWNRSEVSSGIGDLIESISDFLHPEYNLIKCLRKGVVYHHGGMPDTIRLYVENIFSTLKSLEYIITSSTLLEGVNIPAEKIFLLSTKVGRSYFTKSEFKNLIGRVCRFSEIFNSETGDLRMLEPKIYIIKGNYSPSNANIKSFLEKKAKTDLKIEDEVKNVLLKDSKGLDDEEQNRVKEALEYLENIEPNTILANDIEYIQSEIGKLCFKNNVYDFDIKSNEEVIVSNLQLFIVNDKIENVEDLIQAVYRVFIFDVNVIDESFKRLENIAARKFYSMILEWRTGGSSYKQMIAKFVSYWDKLNDPVVYAGSKWGEIPRNDDDFRTLYIDLSKLNYSDRVNLAIVRIKEEQDFVDNTLIKYVEILNDLDLIEGQFYEKVKYGSSDKVIICLLKNGFSTDLAKCITKSIYSKYVRINLELEEVFISKEIIKVMEDNEENMILIFEISYHISQ